MSRRIIPVADVSTIPDFSGIATAPSGLLTDTLARPLRDLRISVTDRCNFRCVYCMPREVFDKDYQFLPHAALLSFEEIERLARIFVAHGVEKIRLTGGEPLLRKNIEFLIERLALLRTPEGRPLDITLTTNGSILARKARSLKDAGLSRVTVSLDALDDALFRRMNDADFAVADVLEGIDAAHAAGLAPLKVNMVVKRGTNDARNPADGAPLQGQRHRAAVHRIHGRGRVERLEHERSAALRGGRRAHRRAFSARPARSAHGRRNRAALGLTRTAAAKSA